MRQLDRDILALAVPSVIANITTPLLGLVDTAITGHLGSESYIAAIAVGASMFNLLYWLFAFLRMGTSGLTAIATGQRDTRQQALILYRGLLVAASVSILMIALSRPIADGLLIFLDPDPATATLARRYFNTVVWGAPAVLATYVLTGWFLGMQSSRRPMIISITINVINIAISPLLAFGAGMKLDGVAAGTLSAQWAGVIIGMLMCMRYRLPKVALREIIDTSQLKRYFAVNRDIMLRTACLIAVTLWFTREGARQGETILAVNALLMQLFILFSYMIDGFAFAGEALVGKFTGCGDRLALRRCIKALMAWGTALATLYTIVYFLCGDLILGILTDSAIVKEAAGDYLPWAMTIPMAGFAAFIWDGVYIGATATRGMLKAMFTAMVSFFVIYFALRSTLGNHALWLAFVAYLLVRGIAQTILWNKREDVF